MSEIKEELQKGDRKRKKIKENLNNNRNYSQNEK